MPVPAPRRARRLAARTCSMTGLLAAWIGHLWVSPEPVGEAAMGTAITLVLALRLLSSIDRDAAAAFGPGWLWATLEHRVGPAAVQVLAMLWAVALFTPYRFPVMIMTTAVAAFLAVATEMVADPRWLTWRGTILAVAVGVSIVAGLMVALLIVALVVAGAAITLLIGLGLVRKAWR